jgi:hypothetical protein
MRLKKDKNDPKMISFLLSAENPEHALKTVRLELHNFYPAFLNIDIKFDIRLTNNR